MKNSTILSQLLLIFVFLLITVICQIILFKTDENTFLEALLSRQWLWLLYFIISAFIVHVVIGRKLK